MREKVKRWNLFSVLAMIALGIPPALLMLAGCGVLKQQPIVYRDIVVFCLLVPAIALMGYFLTLRSRRSTGFKLLLCVLIIVVYFGVSFSGVFLSEYEILKSQTGDEAITAYTRVAAIKGVLPEMEEMGEPETVEYYYYEGNGSIFTWTSDVLICGYSDKTYQEQLSWLEDHYVIQQEQVSAHEYTLEPRVSVDGYDFRMLSFEEAEYQLDYPKYMVFIATNDETQEIVWLYYEDLDIDYIRSLEEHILNDCGWKHIR